MEKIIEWINKQCMVLKVLIWLIIIILLFVISFLIAWFVIEGIIVNGFNGYKPFTTSFSESEWFAFTASYLGAVGSVFVGVVALLQNKRHKEDADAYNKQIFQLNEDYKKNSDEYQKKMDELTLLSEVYPKNIFCLKGLSDLDFNNDSYYTFNKYTSGYLVKKYAIEFIVSKSAIIDFKIQSVNVTYHYTSNDKHTIRSNDINNKYQKAWGNNKRYYSEKDTFIYALNLPQIQNDKGDLPKTINVELIIKYNNLYNMPINKILCFSLNEELARQTTDNGAYATWNIEKAEIIKGENQ